MPNKHDVNKHGLNKHGKMETGVSIRFPLVSKGLPIEAGIEIRASKEP
jgi:hypothetical protein